MASSNLQLQTLEQMPLPSRKNKLAIFNCSYLESIKDYLRSENCHRVVLVASKALAKNTSIISNLKSELGDKLLATKLGVGSHTPYADVLEIVKLLRENKADILISIGSGSYSDSCKIARLLHATLPDHTTLSEEAMESLLDHNKGRTPPSALKGPTTKLILVPTSLSAGEYNAVGSATNSRGKKQHFGAFSRDEHAPDLILLDPRVARTAPRELWIQSGIRAIDHCVEIMVAKGAIEECKGHCEVGLRALISGLREYKEGLDSDEGREEELLRGISNCQKGAREAIMGLIVFGSHMGPSHAIGHQLGSVGKVAHGLTSCICLAPVLRYEKQQPESQYWDVTAHERITNIFNDVLGWKEEEASDALHRFVQEMGMATTLREVNVIEYDQLRKIAENTMTDVWGGGESQLQSPEQVMQILHMVR